MHQGHSASLEGVPATIPEDGPLTDTTQEQPVAEGTSPSKAPEPETEDSMLFSLVFYLLLEPDKPVVESFSHCPDV